MTPQSIITEARYILNDVTVGEYRQSDTELLGYVNDGISEIAILRPYMFQTVGDYACIPSQCEQVTTFANASMIKKVLCIHGGAALTEFDVDMMNVFTPSWRSDTVGAARQWARMEGDLLRFFVYPPAPATAQTLDILYLANPTVLAIGVTITEIPAVFITALTDYVVFRASSKDDEHSNSGRSAALYQRFVAVVGGK